nr:disease resistance protein RPP13-like isoform X6 [Ipomoea batatas]
MASASFGVNKPFQGYWRYSNIIISNLLIPSIPQFPLIVLEIDSTDLKDWKAIGDNFPKLEHLYLFSCTKLKEIPSGFAEISKLKSIQLVDCRPSVVASAEEIKEEQLDYLNNIVDVVVAERRGYSSVSGSESESDEYESNEYESDEYESDEA